MRRHNQHVGAFAAGDPVAKGDLLALYTEIYDNTNAKQARRFDVGIRLMSESGTDVFSSRDEISNSPEKPWDVYGYTRQISLKDIAPGRYLLRVDAQARNNEDIKPAARETLITVLP